MRLTFIVRNLNKTNYLSQLEKFASFNPSPLSIKQFIDFGRNACEKTSFLFLKKELPVRLANIMKEINLLPPNLLTMPSINLVQNWYILSFKELLEFQEKAESDDTLKKFCETLMQVRNRHSDVVQTMAKGIVELKELNEVDSSMEHSIQYFLDRFYMSRISIRMLINQHTLLFGKHKENLNNPKLHIGCIDPQCDIVSVIQDSFENARFLCDQYYQASPQLKITEHNELEPGEKIKFIYIPSHLYHIMFELFKNAMRAVVEHHGLENATFPPVDVLVVNGKEDITIRVSDRGGGISRKDSDLLFQYMYTTAQLPSVTETVPFAGFGYGLPLSRLYARYFQGDLIISSIDGYGTDALIYLKALSNEANELLPIYNKTSSRHYSQSVPAGDWSHSTNGSSNRNHPVFNPNINHRGEI